MKKLLVIVAVITVLLFIGFKMYSKNDTFFERNIERFFEVRDTIIKAGDTLVFLSESGFSVVTKQKMIDAFFIVYPNEVKRFNPNSLKKVTFRIDPDYKAVAETSYDGIATYNPEWMKSFPEDIDVVTHEVMHIVQSYKINNQPTWLSEGIADYVRYKYGINNVKGDWKMPDYAAGQSYLNSYRITARFLVWVEKNVNASIVDDMDKAMRDNTYRLNFG